jgi:hypothetical protein
MKTLQEILPEGLTEQQFISNLRHSAAFLATNGNSAKGCSDAWELVNQVVMLVMEGKQKLPECPKRISYNMLTKQALAYFCGGTMPATSVSSEGYTQRVLKYGKLKQIPNADELPSTRSRNVESDLEEALGFVFAVMTPKRADTLVGLIEAGGSVAKFAEAEGLPERTAFHRVNVARKEFLELLPADSQLFTYARRLFARFSVNRTDIFEEGYADHKLSARVEKAIKPERLPDEALTNLGEPTEHFKQGKKPYMVQAFTIKQYQMEHFYETREEAQKMYDSLIDRSICQRKMVYIPDMKQLEFDSNPNAKPIRKTSPVEKPWIGTLDGRSPEAELNYNNFDN